MDTKKVACLYRVSTKGQVDESDIPMQRIECHKFIERQDGWTLWREYYEKGVSGYKKSASERDVLQEVRADALLKKFDVLLVFMFDRLGRKDDETPFVLQWFSKQGIEVWSTREGQQRFDQHVDKLINYIRFWQSSGESEKTSIRVDAKHTQMAEAGLFRGGVAPLGYTLVPSGECNKKGKPLLNPIIDSNTEPTVKLIYSLVLEKGMGNYRIAQYLNDEAIPAPEGGLWRAGTIGRILSNPVYKGFPAYKKTTKKVGSEHNAVPKDEWVLPTEQIIDLVIIEPSVWNEVQRTRNNNRNDNPNRDGRTTKSPLLLVGIIKCGYCGAPLCTTYVQRSYTDKAGYTKKWLEAKYRCSTKTTKKDSCAGQSTYGRKKVETAVLDFLQDKFYEYQSEIEIDQNNNGINAVAREQIGLQRAIVQAEKEHAALLKEIPKCLIGESRFSENTLSALIHDKELEIKRYEQRINEILDSTVSSADKRDDKAFIDTVICDFERRFHTLTLAEQKKIIRMFIKSIKINGETIFIEFCHSFEIKTSSTSPQEYKSEQIMA